MSSRKTVTIGKSLRIVASDEGGIGETRLRDQFDWKALGLVEPVLEWQDRVEVPVSSWIFPEFGAAQHHDPSRPVEVLQIAGRGWHVFFDIQWQNGYPDGVVVTFAETEATGNPLPTKRGQSHCLGQPSFVQSEVFFLHRGEIAQPLATLEVGWGDCGNINLFLGLDENGEPDAVYFERNCA